MIVRKFTDNDYETLISWNKEWNLPITPKNWIPENSFIIDDTCIGFLYQLDKTPFFWIEGVISNKKLDNDLKKQGLNKLINYLEQRAKELGGDIIMSSTPRSSLAKIYTNNGFKYSPELYFHLGKRL